MSKLITHIKRLALALCFATPFVSWAAEKTNPVTEETETYENVFTGETEEWNVAGNWDTETTPFITTTYTPALVVGKTVSTSTAIDGWTLRVGAYEGANISWNGGITKIQAGSDGCWLTVDETSSITIASFTGNQLEGGESAPFKLTSAKAGGITWLSGLTSASNTTLPFWYYLKGEGTVVYGGDIKVANAQVIKQADVAISGTSQVASKMLVGFDTGTTKTFTADAAIKIKNGDNVLKTVYLTSVSANDDTTLTTEDAVGTCELVQKYDGVYLYWVDGDPANLPAATVYKPSININFTDSGNGLTTGADVGLTDYEVPGASWNNFAGSNGTYGEVKAVADSSGSASVMSGLSVTVSGTRGSWATSLPSSSNPLAGYIDENAGNSAPTVTVTGIPYYKYRVLVYHSTDTEDVPFGYDTINGTNYTYVEDALSEGTTAWGNSGPDDSADAIAEGGNVLVTEAISGSTLTVVGHRAGGANNARGCIAAIQIIEVKADVGENDLEIPVSGDTQYTVEETKELSGTVYLTGSGTLTLAGENKISADTINVGDLVTLVVDSARLDATTFVGAGTVVYDSAKPATGKGWTDSDNWTGTVWVKNIPTTSNERKDWDLAIYGNANSTLRFTGVNLFFKNSTDNVFPGTVDIDGDGMNVCDGYGSTVATFTRLTGSGTLSTTGGSGYGNGLTINDASGFTGTITLTKYKVTVGTSTGKSANGVLEIESGKSITVAGATAPGGFVVNGTLVANGTLDSSAAAAVTGSGTVTFGGVPSPVDGENETKWWKNSAWTGTVEIKGVTALNGDYAFSDYGNAGSTVKLTNCSGWLKPNYTCVPALEIGGTFSWNDGSSNLGNTFKVATLKGSGTISIPNQGAATAVWQITDDWSGFTGVVVGNNTAAKRVLVFGSTLPSTITAGEIYVSEGATLNLDNASGAWWGVGMGFVVDGTVKASSRSKWGGGTYMTLGDTGVLEFVSTANTDDQNTEMGNITGTGTLKFSSTAGWRSFPKTDANMPATTLTIQTELADSLILPTKNDGETVIGNLAGSKNIRSDWSDTGANGRILTVTQSKDTEWQGKFVSNRTTQFNVVAPAEGTPGTLTLSGTQSASVPMQIGGSVNLTGTWVGATTVAGTIGGTGTLTGDLTFNAGSTFKAFSSDEDGLAVSGTIAYPDEGTVTVDVSALTPEADVALLKAADLDATKFALAEGAPEGATLEVVEGVLTLVVPPTMVSVTVPVVANATFAVTVGGETVQPDTEGGNVFTVEAGSAVVVTYSVDGDAYELTNGTIAFTATENVTVAEPTVTAYVAWIYDENDQILETNGRFKTPLPAVIAFGNGTGAKARFAEALTEEQHNQLIAGCSYDAGTITYTRLPTVATITTGAWVHKYPSLKAAVEAATGGDTIVLVADDAVSFSMENLEVGINKAITIDGDGHTLYGVNDYNYYDGTTGGSDHDIYISGTGDITIKNLTIAEFGGESYVTKRICPVWVGAGYTGTLTLKNVTVEDFNRTALNLGGGTVVVDGCAITGDTSARNDKGAYYQDGISVYNAAVTVTNTTIVSVGAYDPDYEDSNAAGCFLVFGGGSITVKDGTYSGQYSAMIDAETAGSISVEGGTFTGDLSVGTDATGTISITGGTFSVDPTDYVASGYKATKSSSEPYTWTVAEVQEIPVTPGSQTEPVDTEAEAEAEAAKVVPSVPAAVAEVLSDDQETAYKTLFEAKVVQVTVGETTKYAVEVVMKADVAAAIQAEVDAEAGDFAEAAAEAAADAVNGGSATVSTVAGLYYVVEAGTEVDGIAPVSCTLATGDTLDLTLPNKGTTGFYKLSVSLTPVQVPSAND